MKLVEILAKKFDVWPAGAAIAVQDGDKRKVVKFGGKHANPSIALLGLKDVWQAADWKFTCKSDFDHSVLASDWKTAIVTEKQWQAERDRQKGGEWKRHRGGKQPVENRVRVECKLRFGDIQQGASDDFLWPHADCDVAANIMQYRVISQPQAEEVEVKDTSIGTLSYKVEIDTSSATQAIDDLAAKWDQVDGPLRWRDCVNELDAYIEEFTREREALINRLAEEGFALLPAMTPVMGVADIDMSDWRNWKDGDLITFTQESEADFTKGKQYVFESYESQDHEISIVADDIGDPNGWKPEFFEWHSRP
jgi:hypothetical protein